MSDDEMTDEETAPAQTALELPEYHGTPAVGMKTSLTGIGKRITRSHEIDEKVVLLVEAQVRSAGHEGTDDGLLYVEKLKTVDLFEVSGETGRRLLTQMRQAYRAGDDAANGKTALALGGIDLTSSGAEVTTDASGIILTAEEIAELRKSDPMAAAEHPQLRPAVIVFSDQSRDLWPDEYEKDDPRPRAGQRFEDDDPDSLTGYVYVVQVLHAETGETLEEWNENAEAERLKAAEVALEDAEKVAANEVAAQTDPGEVPTDPPDEEVEFVEDPEGYAEPSADAVNAAASVVEADAQIAGDVLDAAESNVVPLHRDGEPRPDDSPTAEDFAFVDRQIPEVKADLEEITDLDRLKRILQAEELGRGRGLKPRAGALDAIRKRMEITFLSDEVPTPPPADGGDLAPGPDADEAGDEEDPF